MDNLCKFDGETLACQRCGYVARRLPTFRVCRDLEEMALEMATARATKRIRVPPVMLGDAAATALAAVGLTKERFKKAMGRDCGCAARQSKMNAVGAGLSALAERALNGVANALLPHPVAADDVAAVANALAANPHTNAGLVLQAKKKAQEA